MKKFEHTPIPFSPLANSGQVRAEGKGAAADIFGGAELLSSGRAALFRIGALLRRRAALWVPSYFCPSIKRALGNFFDMRNFDDFPSEPAPRFDTLNPAPGDFVLCVNFFGLRDPEVWRQWRKRNGGALIIEDHTHAPLSAWAKNSDADFSFASLRKYFPIPDGAYLKGKSLAPAKLFSKGGSMPDFSADALQAAALLNARGKYDSEVEALYYSAETKLNGALKPSRMSAYSLAVLDCLDIRALERARAANMGAFAAALEPSKKFRLVGARFNPVLKFETRRECSKAYCALCSGGVFLSVYWGGFGKLAGPALLKEAQTLLCIPIDFRQSPSEAAAAAEILNAL